MERDQLRQLAALAASRSSPAIEILKQASTGCLKLLSENDRLLDGCRLGVFSSSFNPITVAHLQIVKAAARQFDLDEVLALAGTANADKTGYTCSLEQRLEMLLLAVSGAATVSVGVSNTAFFVDMVDALRRIYEPGTNLFFIVGLDTFQRILDPNDRYTPKYNRRVSNRIEALEYLQSNSEIILAPRRGEGLPELQRILASEPALRVDRISYLDVPAGIADRSATEVRERAQAGLAIEGLVPPTVERHIHENGLYRTMEHG